MTNHFHHELEQIQETINWGINVSVKNAASVIGKSLAFPLIAVGSGGSLTAAHMAVLLHQASGGFSMVATPLSLVNSSKIISASSVMLISAYGGNPDIISAFRFALSKNPKQLTVICMKKNSKLGTLAKKYSHVNLLEFDLPVHKDGFLATNSLVALVILLIRLYGLSTERFSSTKLKNFLKTLSLQQISTIANKQTLIVLCNGWGLPAATDAESKFSESALSNIQVVDYRNFAHGRHNWIAKRSDSTTIVALITPSDKKIAKSTLSLLPSSTSILKLETDLSGPEGALELLLKVFVLVDSVGTAMKIDPAKPKVPLFGRKLYNLRNSLSDKSQLLFSEQKVAVLRKYHPSVNNSQDASMQKFWHDAHIKFRKVLNSTGFGCIVFDYDGTLIDKGNPHVDMSFEIIEKLSQILKHGILLGIATGRGKSIRTALQSQLPKQFWDRVVVGYYNGSDIGLLSNSCMPATRKSINSGLTEVKNFLESNGILKLQANIEYRANQISIQAKEISDLIYIRAIVFDLIYKSKNRWVQVVESSHSIDILPFGTSKQEVVNECNVMLLEQGRDSKILCIGDRGEWPGNDFELLSNPYSLSVDTVSPNPANCWNLTPSGYEGVNATLYYLNHMTIRNHILKVEI